MIVHEATGEGIAAVFFDVDDTLIDYDFTSRAAFHHALGEDAG